MDNEYQIEIRSELEKGCDLLDKIPSTFVRWGTVIIVTIILTLLMAVCFVPYPHSCGESILQHLLI